MVMTREEIQKEAYEAESAYVAAEKAYYSSHKAWLDAELALNDAHLAYESTNACYNDPYEAQLSNAVDAARKVKEDTYKVSYAARSAFYEAHDAREIARDNMKFNKI